MFEQTTCTTTVSIVEAIIFGTNGACINIGMPSILGLVAGFVVAVVLLRLMGMWVLRRVFPSLRRKSRARRQSDEEPPAAALKSMPYESPIRSTGAWGSKPR